MVLKILVIVWGITSIISLFSLKFTMKRVVKDTKFVEELSDICGEDKEDIIECLNEFRIKDGIFCLVPIYNIPFTLAFIYTYIDFNDFRKTVLERIRHNMVNKNSQ